MKRALVVNDGLDIGDACSAIMNSNVFTVVGQAATVSEALKLLDELKPDILAIYLGASKPNESEVLKELQGLGKDIKVIIVSGTNRETQIKEAMKAGAVSFVIMS